MIENTSSMDPREKLLDMLVGGGIEGQEQRGQSQLVKSTLLPTNRGRRYLSDDDTEKMMELGFTFGEPLESDPLFCEATLPEGWTKEGSDHAMWSYVLDERGIKRVAVFYKAAFYDRDAFMRLISPGANHADEMVYGDGEVWLNDKFTDDELQQVRDYLDQMQKNIDEFPNIYGDKQDRVNKLRELLDTREEEDVN